MLKLGQLCLFTGWIMGILSTDALGEPPIFSMEVNAVNSTPLAGGPARYLEVLPGDVLTLEVYLRNWSPAGEPLNAYQMQLESLDFTSGSAGAIRPVDYKETREGSKMNLANCFIDQNAPKWVFAGLQQITLVDTRSEGYRWMSVLVDADQAPPSDQDDTKHYTGTVLMKVSDDALGTFTIGFMEASHASLLLDHHGVLIAPLAFESLTLVVQPDILGVIDRLNGVTEVSVERADTDGDGKVAVGDVSKAMDLLNGGGEPAETGTE